MAKSRSKRNYKKIWIPVVCVIAALLLLVIGYLIYVVVSYDRIEDNQVLEVEKGAVAETAPKTDTLYSIITYNIGFGAYSDDFSFFMDGGKYSWAFSEEEVYKNIAGSTNLISVFQPDFIFMQELDTDATRSYHINQLDLVRTSFADYDSIFAYNYFDSPFLMWPLTQPHGKINAGMAVFSKFSMESAVRRSLPIMNNFNRYLDLDRCYTVSRIPMENGATLCLYNVHLSAYGNDASLREAQVSMLLSDMQEEYEAGNYVICGGDFNHNLKLLDEEQETTSWAAPFPRSIIPEGFSLAIDHLSEDRFQTMIPSSRDANEPYQKGITGTYMLDGFLISDNIELIDYNTINGEFEFSDHNPVLMFFRLKSK